MNQNLTEVLKIGNTFLTPFRLFLAILVLVSHSWPIFGKGYDPQIEFLDSPISYGTFAVGCFFAISGLLVANSASKNPLDVWVSNRILRIFPAYLFCITLSSLLLIPLVLFLKTGQINGYFNLNSGGPIGYLVSNAAIPMRINYAINDVFSKNPWGLLNNQSSVINGSLWSLPYELRIYFFVVISFYFVSKKISFLIKWLITSYLLILWVFVNFRIDLLNRIPDMYFFRDPLFIQFGLIFMLGVLLQHYLDKIKVNWISRLIVIALIIFTSQSGFLFNTFGLFLCSLLPILFSTDIFHGLLQEMNDYSFGVYLWAYPIQQSTQYLLFKTDFILKNLIALLITLLMAHVSWKTIESQTWRFRKFIQ